jgi:hypothetical protein
LNLLQLLLALLKLVTRLELQFGVPFPGGCKRSIKAAGSLGKERPHLSGERPIPILVQ